MTGGHVKTIFLWIILLEFHSPSLWARSLSGRFVKNFSQLKESLSKEEVARVKAGHSLFSKPWVQAPSSTLLRNGLGPYFNAVSCMSCHPGFGRGAPPHIIHAQDPSLLFKVEGPIGAYGDQIQTQSLLGLAPEAGVQIQWKNIQVNDQNLKYPHYTLKDFQFGELTDKQYLSPRIAPHLAGLGDLNDISDFEIIQNQRNGGKAQIISGKVARFGWKADKIDLHHQVAAAFQGDLGISNSLFSNQPCTLDQLDCLAFPTGVEDGHEFEISDKHLNFVVELMKAIKSPQRVIKDQSRFKRGLEKFRKIGCNSCHRESYTLNNGNKINPYTDLLLHNMGDLLADQGDLPLAKLWRTPPLWGIASQKLVNGHLRLMHDGRADGVREAIYWHGGEAKKSQMKFHQLTLEDQEDLISFIESL
jgi:CxxC motif-containing protein (DUF1111 family)